MPEPAVEKEVPLEPRGTLGGYINDGMDFFTEADMILEDGDRELRLYGSGPDMEVMLMLGVNIPLGQLEAGRYTELTSDFWARGCSGESRARWDFDRLASEITVIVEEKPEGIRLDYAVGLRSDGGFLTGSAGPF